MSSEKLNESSNEQSSEGLLDDLERLRQEKRAARAEQLENRLSAESATDSREDAIEKHNEALEQAKSVEDIDDSQATQETEKQPARAISSKQERSHAYQRIMTDTRDQMSGPSKAFSKFVHNPVVEKVSDATAATLARPNALLAGSVSAFIIVLGVYLIARNFGYPLSGSETLLAFVIGWVFGLLYDFLRVMITGKTQ